MENRISIKQIMDDILDHPLLRDITLERAIAYAIEFMQIVGSIDAFERKIISIHIDNYRAAIPNDCYLINGVSLEGNNSVGMIEVDYFMDDFNASNPMPVYSISGNILYTSIKTGDIKLDYLAIPQDEEGYPTFINNASYIKALELYIKKKWFTILFDMGKLNISIYNNICQEYAWAVGQAQTDLIRPSVDEMQAFTNMWIGLLPRGNVHANKFKTLSSTEKLKI